MIGEGIENALSAAQLGGGLPAIAGISAKNLAKITPPPAREYIIAADHDPPGLSGASTLAERLVRAGHFVRIAVPPCEGTRLE